MFYLQVMDKISASFVLSAVENVSALSVTGAIALHQPEKSKCKQLNLKSGR